MSIGRTKPDNLFYPFNYKVVVTTTGMRQRILIFIFLNHFVVLATKRDLSHTIAARSDPAKPACPASPTALPYRSVMRLFHSSYVGRRAPDDTLNPDVPFNPRKPVH